MQFPPSVWGPFFWHTIHIVALGYPKNPTYTDSLAFLIPCPVCREHYKEHLISKPISTFLDSRTDLIKWTIDIHNKVNITTGKPEWTLEEVLSYYEKIGNRNRSPVWTRDDMNEVDYRSFIKGFLTGSIVLTVIGSIVYFLQKLK